MRARAIGLAVMIALLSVFCLLLPPRQTADFAALALAVLAHMATVGLFEGLARRPRGLLVMVGCSVTGVCYWLASVVTALLFRLLGIPGTALLAGLGLLYAALAACCCCVFWLARGSDPTQPEEREGGMDV